MPFELVIRNPMNHLFWNRWTSDKPVCCDFVVLTAKR